MKSSYRLMFVCLGNICRSPLAHALTEKLAAELGMAVKVGSSGTRASGHEGTAPDPRMRAVARQHGLELRSRSCQLTAALAQDYQLLLVMDHDNYEQVQQLLAPEAFACKVRLLRDFDPLGPGEVQDPYYQGREGFELTYEVVARCCRALLEELRDRGLPQ